MRRRRKEAESQRKLTDYPSYTCQICGASFSSEAGLKVHMGRMHQYIPSPAPDSDEGIHVSGDSKFIYLTIKMRRKTWDEIRSKLMEENKSLMSSIFEVLNNLRVYGTRYHEWTGRRLPVAVHESGANIYV